MPRRIYIQNQFSHAANEPNLQISLNFQFRQRKSDKANVKARKNEERGRRKGEKIHSASSTGT